MKRPAYDQIVEEIYGALLVDGSFALSVASLGAALGSHVNAFLKHDYAQENGEIDVSGKLNVQDFTTHLNDYSQRWAGENVWMKGSHRTLLTRGYDVSDGLIQDAVFLDTEFYKYALRPLDIRRGCAICMRHQGDTILTVSSFHRSAAKGPWTDRDIALIKRVTPHLQQANRIRDQFQAVQSECVTLDAALERLPIAMLMLDLNGTVVRCNEAASQLFETAASPLGTHRTTLHLRDEVARSELRVALRSIGKKPSDAHARTIVLRAAEALPSHVLRLCALPVSAMTTGSSSATVLVFVVPMSNDQFVRLSEALLSSALRATPAETRLMLALWRLSSLAAAAQALHVSVSTARTQLKQVFNKTGIRSQVELTTVVERLMLAARI